MNSKERINAIFERKPVDRIPVDLWFVPEVWKDLCAHFGVDNDDALYAAMGIDKIVWLPALYPETPGRTQWGSKTGSITAGAASYSENVEPGLAGCDTLEAVKAYPYWPDPEKFDYVQMADNAKRQSAQYVTLGPWISLFEVYCSLRGLEQSMMDVALYPEMVHLILDYIEKIQTEMVSRFLDKAAQYVNMVFISDDMGAQQNLMMSLPMWDTFLKDRLRRWCDLIHSYGVKVFYHSDGAMYDLIPRLIEAGIDVLNPIQHVCPGMEMSRLKAEFGDKLIFHGGVENQSILPFGTAEDVRRETLDCLNTLGKDKQGYICCSCHNIQAGTPVENILMMVDTVKG